MARGRPTRICRVAKWKDIGEEPLDDLALLELKDPAPPEAGVNVFATIAQGHDQTGELSLFGGRGEYVLGEYVSLPKSRSIS